MIGAYIAWTVYVRPDTFVDLLAPVVLLISGFLLSSVWARLSKRIKWGDQLMRVLPWIGLALTVVVLAVILTRYPITIWDIENYAESPVTYSFMADQGLLNLPAGLPFEKISPVVAALGLLIASLLGSFSLSLFGRDGRAVP